MINKLLVYKSHSFNPYENLAIEKYLLDTLPADAFVLYLWQNNNTVVIGKNQNPWGECKCRELEADGGFLARRLSGGGAVFHDKGNLNFTFICGTGNYSLDRNIEIIRNACKTAGIETELSGRNDILCNGKKFSGNAFYNTKGKTYHHGTILINTDFEKMEKYLTPSKAKLESKGVKSVKSRTINLATLSPLATTKNFIDFFIKSTESKLGLKAEILDDIKDREIAENFAKFSSDEWKYGESLPFSLSFSDRFSWGSIEIRLDVKKGIISSCQIFTDSMDETLSKKISDVLSGCEFKSEIIYGNLIKTLPKDIADDIISILKNDEI